MPFPVRDPNAPPPVRIPKGKTKRRRYAMTWCNVSKASADEANHRYDEVASTSVASAHTALLKLLRERFDDPTLKKNQVLVIEAVLIPARTILEEFLGLDEEE